MKSIVTIQVPYKGPGNNIRQNDVSFDVSNQENTYKAIVMLNKDERLVANLPEYFEFAVVNDTPVFEKGSGDCNYHVVQDLYTAIKEQVKT